MGLVSIVAREDFISLVTDLGIHQVIDEIRFKELIPDTAFIAFSSDEEYAMMVASTAETLVNQGCSLKELAESIQSSINNPMLMVDRQPFEAVVAGYSQVQASIHDRLHSRDSHQYEGNRILEALYSR